MKPTWNYRVIEFLSSIEEEPYLEIREVYYDAEGMPNAYAAVPAAVGGSELAWVLDRMREALDKPVLKEADFPPFQNNPSALLPPHGFASWLDYVVATTGAPRDINVQSLFDSSPWGREVSREEIREAIEAELNALKLKSLRGSVLRYEDPLSPIE